MRWVAAVLVAVCAGFGAGYAVGDNRPTKPTTVIVRSTPTVCTGNAIDCVLP